MKRLILIGGGAILTIAVVAAVAAVLFVSNLGALTKAAVEKK